MECDTTNDCSTNLIPNICSESQFVKWQETRTWLRSKRLSDGYSIGITCIACSTIGSLSNCMSTTERVSISQEWLKGITARNSKKLHDKMQEHERSFAHESSMKELKLRASKPTEESSRKATTVWHEQNSAKIEVTSRICRTAYTIAWKHLAFRVHPDIVELQEMNGLDVGNMLFSHHACGNIIKFIASDMSTKLLRYVLKNDVPFALMLDESTTISNKTALIVYIRMLDPEGRQKSFGIHYHHHHRFNVCVCKFARVGRCPKIPLYSFMLKPRCSASESCLLKIIEILSFLII